MMELLKDFKEFWDDRNFYAKNLVILAFLFILMLIAAVISLFVLIFSVGLYEGIVVVIICLIFLWIGICFNRMDF